MSYNEGVSVKDSIAIFIKVKATSEEGNFHSTIINPVSFHEHFVKKLIMARKNIYI